MVRAAETLAFFAVAAAAPSPFFVCIFFLGALHRASLDSCSRV